MATAAGRAFSVPELLEMILLQVKEHSAKNRQQSRRIKDLFTLQRVNKDFQSAITTSIKLQRDMLLAFEDETEPLRGNMYGMEFLLDDHLCATPLHPALPCLQTRNNGPYDVKIQLHADQQDYSDDERNKLCFGCGCSEMSRELASVQAAMSSFAHAYFRQTFSQQASWRRMKLFNRPHVLTIGFCVFTQMGLEEEGGAYRLYARLSCDKRLGDLYDALAVILGRSEEEHYEASDSVSAPLLAIKFGFESWSSGERDTERVANARRVKQSHAALPDCGHHRFECAVCTALCILGEEHAQFMDHL